MMKKQGNFHSKENDNFSFGVITFSKWVTNKQLSTFENHEIAKTLLKKENWDLEHCMYLMTAETELFSIAAEIRIERLNLSKNRCPNIIRELKEISFPMLTKLLLNDNHIISLQFLDHINCPNLQAIALMNNKITHLRTLKKTKYPNLNYIALQRNLIQNLSMLGTIQSQNLNQLLIETDSNNQTLGHDITWISKLNSIQLKQIWMQGSNRINTRKIKKMLQRKFQFLSLQDKYKHNTF